MDKIKILLVDDETLLLESLEIILSLNDMEVIGTAHDGNEALSILQKQECSLALVDLNMKGMGGIELTESESASLAALPVAIKTSSPIPAPTPSTAIK